MENRQTAFSLPGGDYGFDGQLNPLNWFNPIGKAHDLPGMKPRR